MGIKRFIRATLNWIRKIYIYSKKQVINFERKSLSNINRFINKIYINLDKKLPKDKNDLFEDLTPVVDYKENEYYCEKIEWALRNPNVNNIALTGIYGSGKSSILKSFKNNHCEYRYLDISMANFSDDDIDDSILEKGILQQLFYKVKFNKIPYSRFKKISKVKVIPLIIRILIFISAIISGIMIFNPEYIQSHINNIKEFINLNDTNIKKVIIIVATFIFASTYIFIYLTKRFFSKVKLKGISLTGDKATAEVGEEDEASIFNKYIDEIIYFFEETRYDVVIFEDLDRFNKIDIFTKLRQLNILLNNSEQINKRIVFLYAIKDDIFCTLEKIDNNMSKETNKEISKDGKDESKEKRIEINTKDCLLDSKLRTKFFDFIIPVIPVVTSSNAYEKIINRLKEAGYFEELDEDFISDISFLINDMRLLTNICNEYIMYRDRLRDKTDAIKDKQLFAMIVYKNVYPKDFSDLQIDSGILHKIFTKEFKELFIKNELEKVKKDIEATERKIEVAERETANSISELRSIYLLELVRYSPGHNIKYESNYSDYIIDLKKLDNSETFNELLNKEKIYYYYDKNNNYKTISGEYINSTLIDGPSYRERERVIKIKEENVLKPVTELLKEQLEDLRKREIKLSYSNIREIVTSSSLKNKLKDSNLDVRLIVFMVINGYIDENYSDYISYFYEGKITKSDQVFIQANLYEEKLSFDYQLIKVKSVIDKMKDIDFEKEFSLNFTLLNYIIENKNNNRYEKLYSYIIKQLSNENKISLQFIEEYIDREKNIDIFIGDLSKEWIRFAEYIIKQSDFSKSKKDMYLKNIIINNDIDTIKKMNINDVIREYLAEMPNFIEVYDDENIDKIKLVIDNLNIYFSRIELKEYDSELLKFIYNGSYNKININMLKLFLINFSTFNDAQFNKRNYTTILTSNCDSMISNINNNIDSYIEDVFLKLEDNNYEDEESFVRLLNSKATLENKKKIISKEKILINSIETVTDELWDYLLDCEKIAPDWDNVLKYYKDINKINKVLATYLNREKVYSKLSEVKITDTNEDYKKFSNDLINNNLIDDKCFKKIVENLPIKYFTLSFSQLRIERIEDIVNYDILELNSKNINFLKKRDNNLHILLIVKNIDIFVNSIDEFNLDNDELLLLVKNNQISFVYKEKIIEHIKEIGLLKNVDIACCVANEYIMSKQEISKNIMDIIIYLDISKDLKFNLFCSIKEELTNDEIKNYLNNLNDPYRKILYYNEKIILNRTEDNCKFINKINKCSNIEKIYQRNGKIYIKTKGKNDKL
ncbi:hypothetical protein [Clostridium sp.]|uniref:YobI family P-loop NTPase n=1 Tax=Clostridium sp. TaxID=1506 RepID=UPI0029141EC0|nr:hypothetical protein [Clostridium sp.]MDU3411726.1 hypothetical protein [Clostridium sp.]